MRTLNSERWADNDSATFRVFRPFRGFVGIFSELSVKGRGPRSEPHVSSRKKAIDFFPMKYPGHLPCKRLSFPIENRDCLFSLESWFSSEFQHRSIEANVFQCLKELSIGSKIQNNFAHLSMNIGNQFTGKRIFCDSFCYRFFHAQIENSTQSLGDSKMRALNVER